MSTVWVWPKLSDQATPTIPDFVRIINSRMKGLQDALPQDLQIVTPQQFGQAGSGTNSTAAFLAFFAALKAGGVLGLIPPDTYLLTSAATLTPGAEPIGIFAYGAVIKTVGAIPGITVSGITSSTAPVMIAGLKVNHRANANATYGFNIVAPSVRLVDCTVVAHGVQGNYASFRFAQSDAADPGTGAFWGVLERPWTQKEDGADVGDIPIGVLLEGSANAVDLLGGGLANTTVGVLLRDQSGGDGRVPNGCSIDGVKFETYGTAIKITSSSASANLIGPYISPRCRFEAGTKVLEITGITHTPDTPPILAGMPTTSAGIWITNPNNLPISSFDYGQPFLRTEEEITLNTGGVTTDSTLNLLPANSIIEAVAWRVTTSISVAANWSLGDATTATRFVNASTSLTAGNTGVGQLQMQGSVATDAAGPVQTTAAKLRVTTNANPGAGKIRITVYSRQFAPATS